MTGLPFVDEHRLLVPAHTGDLGSGPEVAEFLDEHVREMRSITPPESKHALDLDGLRRPR